MTEHESKLSFIRTYGGDEHFMTKTWANYRVDVSNDRAVKILQSLQLGRQPGAYVRGPVGSGKTHVMKAMFNHLVDWKIELQAKGHHSPLRPFWINMSLYLDELRHENYAIKKRSQQATVLFIDDIGTSTKTDWVTDQVFQLIDWRAERELQTFMTSNLKLADLEPIYGDRVVSRIYSMCVVVEMLGRDKRKEQLQTNFESVLRHLNPKPDERKE